MRDEEVALAALVTLGALGALAVGLTYLILLGKFLHKMRMTQNISCDPSMALRLMGCALALSCLQMLFVTFSVAKLCNKEQKGKLKDKGTLLEQQVTRPIVLIPCIGAVAALSFAIYAFKHPQEQLISPNGMIGLLVAETLVPFVVVIFMQAIFKCVGPDNSISAVNLQEEQKIEENIPVWFRGVR